MDSLVIETSPAIRPELSVQEKISFAINPEPSVWRTIVEVVGAFVPQNKNRHRNTCCIRKFGDTQTCVLFRVIGLRDGCYRRTTMLHGLKALAQRM